jgi:diguanylate cyclase (GGDEF)-like protein
VDPDAQIGENERIETPVGVSKTRSKKSTSTHLARGIGLIAGLSVVVSALAVFLASQNRVGALIGGVVAVLVILGISAFQYQRLSRDIAAPLGMMAADITRIGGDGAFTLPESTSTELNQIFDSVGVLNQHQVKQMGSEYEILKTLSNRQAELRQLEILARDMAVSVSLLDILRALAVSATSIVSFPRAIFWLPGQTGNLQPILDSRASSTWEIDIDDIDSIKLAMLAAQRNTWVHKTTSVLAPVAEGTPTGPVESVAYPLSYSGRLIAVMELRADMPTSLTPEEATLLGTLINQAAGISYTVSLREEVVRRSEIDSLTTLMNRARLDHDLNSECARGRGFDNPLTFVLFDVDHFKEFNDKYGHQTGDKILKTIGGILNATLRKTDSAYRYGGEEFSIILRDTSEEIGMMVTDRIREKIAGRCAAIGLAVTASFGISTIPANATTPEELIATADAALYTAKNEGRNRTVVSTVLKNKAPVK